MALNPLDFQFLSQLVRQRSAIVLELEKSYLLEARLTPLARMEGFGSIDAMVAQMRLQPNNGLHRKVVLLGGTAAMGVAGVCLAVVAGVVPSAAGCVAGLFVVGLYAVALSVPGRGLARLRLPRAWITWL